MFILLSFLIISSFATASAENSSQIYSKDMIGWIVTFSATIPPAIGLIYTAIQIKNESNAKYIQTFREIEKEITDMENHADRGSTDENKRKIWEINFLNIMDKNAFLLQSKRYPKDLLDIFKNDFGYALHLIGEDTSRKTDYPKILELCNKKKWPAYNPDKKTK